MSSQLQCTAEPAVISHVATIKEEEEEDLVHDTPPLEESDSIPKAPNDTFAILAVLPPGPGGRILQVSQTGGGRRHTSPQAPSPTGASSQPGEQCAIRVTGTGELVSSLGGDCHAVVVYSPSHFIGSLPLH